MFSFYDYGDMQNLDNYNASIKFWGTVYLFVFLAVHNYFWYCVYCLLSDYKWYLLAGNSLFGAFLLEWMWNNTQRIHNFDDERDSGFPAFRRPEAKHWNKWLMYPCALTLTPVRVWCAILTCPGSAVCSNIVLFGHKTRPVIGWRKIMIDVHYKGMQYLIFIAHGMWNSTERL